MINLFLAVIFLEFRNAKEQVGGDVPGMSPSASRDASRNASRDASRDASMHDGGPSLRNLGEASAPSPPPSPPRTEIDLAHAAVHGHSPGGTAVNVYDEFDAGTLEEAAGACVLTRFNPTEKRHGQCLRGGLLM